jgi:hypothetical protein
MGSHKTFQFFNNLIPLPFVIECKICKVDRMHLYEYGGVFLKKEKRKGGPTFGLGMKDKMMIKVVCTYMQMNFNCFLASWICPAYILYPKIRYYTSDSALVAKNLGQPNFSLTFTLVLHIVFQSFLSC